MPKYFGTMILMAELEVMLIYKYLPVILPRNLVYTFRRDWSTCALKKKFHSFYTFKLMTHFLAEEGFLNMHSDVYSYLLGSE